MSTPYVKFFNEKADSDVNFVRQHHEISFETVLLIQTIQQQQSQSIQYKLLTQHKLLPNTLTDTQQDLITLSLNDRAIILLCTKLINPISLCHALENAYLSYNKLSSPTPNNNYGVVVIQNIIFSYFGLRGICEGFIHIDDLISSPDLCDSLLERKLILNSDLYCAIKRGLDIKIAASICQLENGDKYLSKLLKKFIKGSIRPEDVSIDNIAGVVELLDKKNSSCLVM